MVYFEVMQFDVWLHFFLSLLLASCAIQGNLLPYEFQDRLYSNSSSNIILMEISLNVQVAFSHMDILTMLILWSTTYKV